VAVGAGEPMPFIEDIDEDIELEHFMNLPLLSRQCLGAGEAIMLGHFMNLPLLSRHCLADAALPSPTAKESAMTAAIKRFIEETPLETDVAPG
jgi:hypothetical protein